MIGRNEPEPGQDCVTPLTLEVIGKGELELGILPQSVFQFLDDNLRVRNEKDFQSAEVASLIRVRLDKSSNAFHTQCYASLISNCYLANRQILPFTARYKLNQLVSDPPALYFSKVFLFGEKHAETIKIQYKEEMLDRLPLLDFDIPEELAQSGLLQLSSAGGGAYQFVLNPQGLSSSKKFSKDICVEIGISTYKCQYGRDHSI